jgi:hypothetical protein
MLKWEENRLCTVEAGFWNLEGWILSKLPRFCLFLRLRGDVFEGCAWEGGNVDHLADLNRAIRKIDCVIALREVDGDGRAGADDDLAIIDVKSAALEGFGWAEDGGDEPPAAGDGVNLASLGANAGFDEFVERAVVWTGDLQMELIRRVGGIEDDQGIFDFENLSAGEKTV